MRRCRVGGVIDPAVLVRAYSEGLFPMALEDGDIGWFSPDPRGVLPLETFHISSRLARTVRRATFDVRVNGDFRAVLQACADDREEGTWINREIAESYIALHRLGLAHSVETWQGNTLVGGLYGVSLGGAFFGESMFHRVTDASKVALVALVDRLVRHGFSLLDTQWVTPHLEQFGAIEIPRPEYLRRLHLALSRPCRFADPAETARPDLPGVF
ncbi:MAG: leucyl/phenylalanyl-tRNA--protein transferase [Vicinamibacterales bacterium]